MFLGEIQNVVGTRLKAGGMMIKVIHRQSLTVRFLFGIIEVGEQNTNTFNEINKLQKYDKP